MYPPRYIINRLSSALVKEGTSCINPLDALRALKDGFEQHTGITREEREQYLNFIYEARKEFDELAKTEIQRAFIYSFEDTARTVFNNYLDNVEAFYPLRENSQRIHAGCCRYSPIGRRSVSSRSAVRPPFSLCRATISPAT